MISYLECQYYSRTQNYITYRLGMPHIGIREIAEEAEYYEALLPRVASNVLHSASGSPNPNFGRIFTGSAGGQVQFRHISKRRQRGAISDIWTPFL